MAPVLLAFGLSRALLAIVTGAVAVIQWNSPIAIWNQWDSRWYVGIAAHGYHWHIGSRSALAFYPLFPAMLHVLAAAGIPLVAAGLLISNVAFLGALFYLHELVKERWGGQVAARTVLIAALFPTAFFTAAPYTESLFLLCAVAVLFHARRGQALVTGLWLAGATLTHSTAIILIIPALILLEPKLGTWTSRLRTLVMVLAPASLSWLIYAAYLLRQHISPGLVLSAQEGWHRSLSFPWVGFLTSAQWLMTYASGHLAWATENVSELIVTFMFLALTALAWRRMDTATRAYCAGFWIIVLCASQWRDSWYAPFGSMDRFVLALFPVAAWAGWRLQGRALHGWLIFSAAAMCTVGGVYVAGGWVG